MLGYADIKNELGKNIFIYPVYADSIKSNSIDLHASPFAWSLRSKKRLEIRTQNETKYIVIPKDDTALIYTEESIHVTNKIGGTYHSKVMYVSSGLGHISTTLDAGYIGQSLMAFHNHSGKDFLLELSHEICTVHFYYIHDSQFDHSVLVDNSAAHLRLLNNYDIQEYSEWFDRNKWCLNVQNLETTMLNSEAYKKLKQDFENEQLRYSKKAKIKKWVLRIGMGLIGITVFYFAYVNKSENLENLSNIFSIIFEYFIVAVVSAAAATVVVNNKK